MTQHAKSAPRYEIEALVRPAVTAVIAMLALLAPAAVLAQGAPVTLQQDATVYRAFYYDASNNLLHVENVTSVGGRFLMPLFSTPPAAPAAPPNEGPAVTIGANVSYAIYYGTVGPNQLKPQQGDSNVLSKAVAFERLSAADAHRAIECAQPGGDTCLYPKMCHCSPVGGCCCY